MNTSTWLRITGFKKGAKIFVHPENKGLFTKAAKAHGMSPLQYAHHIMASDTASTTMKHRAQFVINARKFKHK